MRTGARTELPLFRRSFWGRDRGTRGARTCCGFGIGQERDEGEPRLAGWTDQGEDFIDPGQEGRPPRGPGRAGVRWLGRLGFRLGRRDRGGGREGNIGTGDLSGEGLFLIPGQHVLGVVGLQEALALNVPQHPFSHGVLQALQAFVGESGGLVEAEAGFWIGRILIRVILDLLEKAIDHAQGILEMGVEAGAETMEEADGPATAPTAGPGMSAGRWLGWGCGPPGLPASRVGLNRHQRPLASRGARRRVSTSRMADGWGGRMGRGARRRVRCSEPGESRDFAYGRAFIDGNGGAAPHVGG